MTDQPNDPYRQWNGQQWMTWDGTQWNPEVTAMPAPSAGTAVTNTGMDSPIVIPVPAPIPPQTYGAPPVAPRKSHKVCWSVLGVVGVLVIIAIIAGALSSGSKSSVADKAAPVATQQPTPDATTPAPDQTTPAAEATTEAPTPEATTAPPAPDLTVSQQQAVDSASSYLDGEGGFSEKGLIQQLTSKYGEGFPKADALFAIKYLHPDWNAQAVMSAKGYLAVGGFSRSGLLQQLTSSYGAGFTNAQAQYALKKVGLG